MTLFKDMGVMEEGMEVAKEGMEMLEEGMMVEEDMGEAMEVDRDL